MLSTICLYLSQLILWWVSLFYGVWIVTSTVSFFNEGMIGMSICGFLYLSFLIYVNLVSFEVEYETD